MGRFRIRQSHRDFTPKGVKSKGTLLAPQTGQAHIKVAAHTACRLVSWGLWEGQGVLGGSSLWPLEHGALEGTCLGRATRGPGSGAGEVLALPSRGQKVGLGSSTGRGRSPPGSCPQQGAGQFSAPSSLLRGAVSLSLFIGFCVTPWLVAGRPGGCSGALGWGPVWSPTSR